MAGAPLWTFRLITAADMTLLHEWLHRPHVAAWWAPSMSLDEVKTDFQEFTGPGGRFQGYIAYRGDRAAGYIQSYVVMGSGGGWWEDETDPGARGIDQFLADGNELGRGLGTEMVRAFVERLFEGPAVTRVQTDPDPANPRAIRCYEKAGFKPGRTIDTPDGPALVMICLRPTVR